MGSSGQKPRKKKSGNQQHIAKVGSTPGESHQHEERDAVMDVMGMHGSPGALRAIVWVIIILLVAGAIFGLLLLTVFK